MIPVGPDHPLPPGPARGFPFLVCPHTALTNTKTDPNPIPTVNRIAALSDEMAAWRHDLHENPQLLYEVHRTAGIVADKLRDFGCDEVVTGIGRTGVVGVIRGRKST